MNKTIINDIDEPYCSFEVSKLLKELGFDVNCRCFYELSLKARKNKQDGYSGSFGWKKGELNIHGDFGNNSDLAKYYDGNKYWYGCTRPTHAVAIEWIRLNFGYRIYWEGVAESTGNDQFEVTIIDKYIGHCDICEVGKSFAFSDTYMITGQCDSPYLAIDKILYNTLENLLKDDNNK